MEIKITHRHLLLVLQVFSWLVFIGLSIDAGGYLFNSVYAMYKPIVAEHFWKGANYKALYELDRGQFLTQTFLVGIVATLKAILFYVLINMFHDKNFNLEQPFQQAATRSIFLMAWISLGVAVFAHWGRSYSEWLHHKGIDMPNPANLGLTGGESWFFMTLVLMVIGQVFKKGMSMQAEIDLTV